MIALLALVACAPCGEGRACAVDDGRYLVVAPDGWDGRTALPTVVFFHGYGSSAEEQVDNASLRDFRAAGWLTVLPDGVGRTWSNVGSPTQDRDEIPFVAQVLDDVEADWPVEATVASGFSQGSSMAWDAACYLPERFDALMGASGSFWQPEPTRCDGPVPVRHTHGTADGVMPLEGRPIGDAHQGDLDVGMAAWRVTNGLPDTPTGTAVDGPETCTVWSDGDPAHEVQRCLFDGGHRRPSGWTDRMLAWWATLE